MKSHINFSKLIMDKTLNEQFESALADLEKESRAEPGPGHDALIADCRTLLAEAVALEFHDFANDKYPAPKVALVQILDKMSAWVKEGKYDN